MNEYDYKDCDNPVSSLGLLFQLPPLNHYVEYLQILYGCSIGSLLEW